MYGRRPPGRYSTPRHMSGMGLASAQQLQAVIADRFPTASGGFRVVDSFARVGAGISELVETIAQTPHAGSVSKEVAELVMPFTTVTWRVGLPLSECIQSVATALLGLGLSPSNVTALFQWYVWGQVSVVMASVDKATALSYGQAVAETLSDAQNKSLAHVGISPQLAALLRGTGLAGGVPAAAAPSATNGINPGGGKLNSEDNIVTRGLYGMFRTFGAMGAGAGSWHDDREMSTTKSTSDKVAAPGASYETKTTTTKTVGPVMSQPEKNQSVPEDGAQKK